MTIPAIYELMIKARRVVAPAAKPASTSAPKPSAAGADHIAEIHRLARLDPLGSDTPGERQRAAAHTFGQTPYRDVHAGFSAQMVTPERPDRESRTYHTKVGSVQVRSRGADYKNLMPKVSVYGTIHHDLGPDKQPKTVGEFHRTFRRQANGDLHVDHSYLHIDPDHRGHGIATQFLKNSLGLYHKMGVKRITATPEDVGTHTWAAMGFNWGAHGTKFVHKHLPKFLNEQYGVDRDAAEHIARKHGHKPWEIAALRVNGERAGQTFLMEHRPMDGSTAWDDGAYINLNDHDAGYRQLKKYTGWSEPT